MRYTDSHEWISIDGKIGTVGISIHGKQELGDIVYVELPRLGTVVKQGDEIAVLESTKAAADIYTPVSGKIVEINTDLSGDLTSLNSDPESLGWLFKIELAKVDELEKLLDTSQYQELFNQKVP